MKDKLKNKTVRAIHEDEKEIINVISQSHPLVAELHITDEDGNLLFSIDEQDGQFNIIACNEISYYAVFSDGRVMACGMPDEVMMCDDDDEI